ncbi:MAG: LuxR C-terminal-related transcriptional regulator [Dehalococcoidia bacterium]
MTVGNIGQLTKREVEVLSLIAGGMSNKEIALELGVTLQTVKWHLLNTFSKMGVNSRTEAVLQGLRQGWIAREDTELQVCKEGVCRRFLEEICAAKRFLEEIRGGYFKVQNGRFVSVGGELIGDCGYTVEELIGRPFIHFIAPEEREQIQRFCQTNLTQQWVSERHETVVLTNKQTRKQIEISAYKVGATIAGIANDITDKKAKEAELLRIREEECRRLVQQLHDGTIEELLLIGQRLQGIIDGTCGSMSSRCRELLAEASTLVQQTTDQIRSFTYDAIVDRLGLVPALTQLIDSLTAIDGLHVNLDVVGEERRLPREIELALFSIGREALSNISAHTNGIAAAVVLEFSANKVSMSVSCDGNGCAPPPDPTRFNGHHRPELARLIDRFGSLGGSYGIQSKPGKQTAVEVEIDVSSEAVSHT